MHVNSVLHVHALHSLYLYTNISQVLVHPIRTISGNPMLLASILMILMQMQEKPNTASPNYTIFYVLPRKYKIRKPETAHSGRGIFVIYECQEKLGLKSRFC